MIVSCRSVHCQLLVQVFALDTTSMKIFNCSPGTMGEGECVRWEHPDRCCLYDQCERVSPEQSGPERPSDTRRRWVRGWQRSGWWPGLLPGLCGSSSRLWLPVQAHTVWWEWRGWRRLHLRPAVFLLRHTERWQGRSVILQLTLDRRHGLLNLERQ